MFVPFYSAIDPNNRQSINTLLELYEVTELKTSPLSIMAASDSGTVGIQI